MTAAVPSRMRPEREIPPTRHRCQACYDTGLVKLRVAGRANGSASSLLESFAPCACEAADQLFEEFNELRQDVDLEAGSVSCQCTARASVITAGVARCRKCSRAFVDDWKRKRSQ